MVQPWPRSVCTCINSFSDMVSAETIWEALEGECDTLFWLVHELYVLWVSEHLKLKTET